MDKLFNKLVAISFIMFLATFFYSLIIIVFGKKLFKKSNKNENSSFYPLVNLFTILEIGETNVFVGIMFFIPILNIIALFIAFYKLGIAFKCSFLFNIGLSILPVIFVPILANNDKQYKLNDEEFFKALDNVKDKNINLMTQDEIISKDSHEEIEEEKVDSIFKSEIDLIEKPQEYKARKTNFMKYDNFNNQSIDINKNNNNDESLKKNKEIEFLDL